MLNVWMYLLAALFFTSVGGTGAWWATQAHYKSQLEIVKRQHSEAIAQALERNRAATQIVFKKYEGALNAARNRNTVVQGAADGARDELERLRSVIATRAAQPAEPAPTACTVAATARDELQRTCEAAVESLARELVDVARAADAHASDLKTMIDAWPTNPPH